MYLLRFLRVVQLRSAVALVISDFLRNLPGFVTATLDHPWRSRHASSLLRLREVGTASCVALLFSVFVWLLLV
jgi:hypothetical protein